MKISLILMSNGMAEKRPHERRHGFTLIEITIAIAILAFIGGITFYSVIQIIQSKKILDDRDDAQRIAIAVLNRMTRELQLAYSGIGLMPRPESGSKRRLPSNINLIGKPKKLPNGKRGDSIRFIALEGGQYLPDGGTHSGVVQIMYRVEENPETKDDKIPTYVLVREEIPIIMPVEKAFAKMMVFPVSERILSLSFRYYDEEEDTWVNTWGQGDRVKLPLQIELRLEILSPQGIVHKIVTAVPLRNIN
ncbi:MAG: prepilin-type N-terminal cleavage/methylation domain-containing protein [Candidatus Dadabacteria bacterium]|nr:MAG: prepilin-type N-terminal cleavage/methylation domain-containing protein [Candidatus Dadabacteria bacterium]